MKISPLLIERNGQPIILHHSQFDNYNGDLLLITLHTFRIEVVSTMKILNYNNTPLLGGSKNSSRLFTQQIKQAVKKLCSYSANDPQQPTLQTFLPTQQNCSPKMFIFITSVSFLIGILVILMFQYCIMYAQPMKILLCNSKILIWHDSQPNSNRRVV